MTILFALAAVLYAAACAFFFAALRRGTEHAQRAGTITLGAAAVLHVAFLATDVLTAPGPKTGNIHQTLVIASLLIVIAYLIALRRYRIGVLGAFLTPVTLLFFLGGGLGRSVGHVPPHVRSALLPLHIGANVLGVVAFTLAFATAVAYVMQERQLRQKKLGGVFQRLPPLDVLDSLSFRLVMIGFPLLTIGIVTGAIWAFRLDPKSPAISAQQGFGLLAWLVFAAVLLLRVAAGWRGRRAAIGTIMGFGCAAAVLVGYILRADGAL